MVKQAREILIPPFGSQIAALQHGPPRPLSRAEREGLKGELPSSITAKPLLFSALETALGFQAWQWMRQDQGLSADEAERVMRFTVERLIGDP